MLDADAEDGGDGLACRLPAFFRCLVLDDLGQPIEASHDVGVVDADECPCDLLVADGLFYRV